DGLVVTVYRNAEDGEVVTHIAFDNESGGEKADDYIAKQLDENGDFVELEGSSGSSTTRERGKVFHNIVDEMDDIDVVANQSADCERTKGLSVMENILQSKGEIDAVFAHNDEMALGSVEA